MFHVNIHPFMYKIKMEYAKDMEKRGIGFVNEKFAWKMRKNIQIKMTFCQKQLNIFYIFGSSIQTR